MADDQQPRQPFENTSNSNNHDPLEIDHKNEIDTDQNKNNSSESQPERAMDINNDSNSTNNNNESSSDDNKSNLNSSANWNCGTCTFSNDHDGYLCTMCNASRFSYDEIHKNAWNKLLSSNYNKLIQIPQWVKCTKCEKWRTIKVATTMIKTWTFPTNYLCPVSICNTPQLAPSPATHTQFEILALSMQRWFAHLQVEMKPEYISQLEQIIATSTKRIETQWKLQLNHVNTLNKRDTIIIEPENESENESEQQSNHDRKSPTPWTCDKCTFKNVHLGNLCAMCNNPKPGSTSSKYNDETYAKLIQKSFEQGRDISKTPDLDAFESSPDLGRDISSQQKREMSIDDNETINNNYNNYKATAGRLQNLLQRVPNAEIGPFGVITCVRNGHRTYLMQDPTKPSGLKWSETPPKQAQTWVRDKFGDGIDVLPKMHKTQRKQIEQLNGNGHYFDQPTDLIFKFDDQIDLTNTNDNNNSDNDIEIIDMTGEDEQMARRLQNLFDDESKPQRSEIPIKKGYFDFENRNNNNNNKNNAFRNPKADEDIMDFDFNYPGMHAADDTPIINGNGLMNGLHGHGHDNDNNEQSVAKMLNMGLRQEKVQPINRIKGLSITLFDHQRKGVAWMVQMEQDKHCKGGFLCDQMGVGKTIQIIALMLESRRLMIEEAKRKYKEDGYVSEQSNYEDSVDSQDETCGGFVVHDDQIDFQSDNEISINNNNNNNENKNNNGDDDDDVDEDDWFPGMDCDSAKEKSEEANNNNNNNNNNSIAKRLKRANRGKKRKFSDLDYDSEKTIDTENEEQNEIGSLNDLARSSNKNTNSNNSNTNNSNSNNREDSLGSDSPFVLNDDFDDEQTDSESPDLVGSMLDRMRNRNKKKKKKKKKVTDYFSTGPVAKRRKLNNGNSSKKKSKRTNKKKKKRKSNAIYEQWHTKNFGKSKSKPWIGMKQRTLIVGPLAIIDQWAEEIKDRAPGQFKVCVYHGSGRKKKYNKHSLKKYDAVITTYGHVTSEYHKGNEEKMDGLFKLPSSFFHRVVLDEAHTIKNPSSQQSKACAQIGNRGVKVRWCLTGTPIQNKLLDLFPLARFLQIRQCGTAKDFKRFLRISSGKRAVESSASRQLVTSFLAAHMLRRLKDEVVDDLVSKTQEVIELQFDEAEDHVYKAFQNHARSRFNKYVQQGTAKKNYAHILVLLLRLRQICDHPYLAMKIQDGQSEDVGEGNSEKESESDTLDVINGGGGKDPLSKIDENVLRRLNERDDGILDSECPICLDIFNDGIMFPKCGHLVCKEHLYDLEEKCPECRANFRVNKVISFAIIIKSALVDEKHKKSLLANDGKDGLIMDGNIVADKMGNVSITTANRRIVWRKVSKAKGKFRSEEQVNEDNESKENNDNNSQEIDVKNKLKKMQEKFEWTTYQCDETFNAEFNDDDENGYVDEDKYPNEEFGWKFIPSSKTKMMMQKIQWIRQNKPNDKIIVFSQFTTMLSILERVLRKYNINYLMYDGSKTRQQRKDIIDSFKRDAEYNDIPVMLMSLKCAALGLNLTVANHVIFCDLWWNPAIESQAIDRVHRIGQTKHVFITRMIIKTSVEERILSLQRDKQKIADSALDGANFVKRNGLSVRDLAMLFGSDENIVAMADRQSGGTGFSRDQLMNVRRPNNHNHNHNHHNNNNYHNHNHHVMPQPQPIRPHNGYDYSLGLDPATIAAIQAAQR